MSQEYARARVKEALEQSDGNYMKAQRMLLNWIEKDANLLLGLAGPHMQSIISYAIGHELSDEQEKTGGTAKVIKGKGGAKKATVREEDLGDFGKSLLSSLKGGPRFGEEQPRGTVSRPGKASQKHVDAMRMLATASAAKGMAKNAKSAPAKSPADVLKKNKKKDD